jgi:membrane protein implicated in regulation of membrane protease activity
MSGLVGTFLAIGGFALLLLVLSLLGGHLGHLHLGHFHLGHIHLGHFHLGQVHPGHGAPQGGHGDGVELSLPVIAGFLGAFGFAGAVGATLSGGHGGAALGVGVAAGFVAAVPTAFLAGKVVHAAMNMPTDGTLQSSDLVGASGVVITPVPVGGYGEVRLALAGQYLKFNARAAQPLALGTRVFVIEVPSPTSVLVEPTPSVQ